MVTRCGEYQIAATSGQSRSIGCDVWRNDIFPHNLTMMVNDYAVLGQLVKSGQV